MTIIITLIKITIITENKQNMMERANDGWKNSSIFQRR